MAKRVYLKTGALLNHPNYEKVLQEVLTEKYQVPLFEIAKIEARDISHAQALYIQARLQQIDDELLIQNNEIKLT